MADFTLITRAGVDPHTAPNKPPLPPTDYRRTEDAGLIIERNLVVPLRDGTRIYIDLHRPAQISNGLPLLLAWSPYGKHGRTNQVFWPASGVDPSWLSPLTAFEAPDPVFWGSQGFAVAYADPRGAWLSEGDFHHNGLIEAQDCYDTIQWLAAQPWSNGKVGMTGVSYLACIQYLVAPLKPPALAAINPWEGFSDWYREFAYHGGIPETGFTPRASDNIRFSLGRTEDTWANVRAHPLWDAFWASKELALDAIETPAYVVASWADQGLHTRGTLEAFKRMRSRDKWLEVHGQKKWAHYYRPESRARQRDFFAHYLLQRSTVVPAWPKVRLEIRERAAAAVERLADAWPLPQTRYQPLWLDARSGLLGPQRVPAPDCVRYDARQGRATFDHTFAQATELTGHSKLRLWIQAEGSDDMDLFVALQKLDVERREVGMTFYAFYGNGPVALGWLRASHRALDPVRSTDWQPFHPHDAEQRLGAASIVPLDIEIWPSATRFAAGETLRVVVQGSDVYQDALPRLPFARHEETRNSGTHILWTGGEYDSHLLVPVVAAGAS